MPQPSGIASQHVATAWQALVTDVPTDNIFDEYSELRRMEEGKAFLRKSGGRSLIGSIEYLANSTVESISPYQALDTTPVDVFDETEANWKQYGGTFSMSSFEEAINRGDSAKFDLEKGKLKNLRQSMRDTINSHIFGASVSATDLTGYQTLIPDSPVTGTVQTINRATSTNAFWRTQQTAGTNSGTAYNNLRAAMRTMRTACAKGQGVMYPTRYVTGPATCNGYESLLIANERINDKKDSTANAAFSGEAYYFGLAKVFWDDDTNDTRMYALNDENLKMAYQAGSWFRGYPAVNPANGLYDVFKAETMCQLFVTASRHLGVITAIS